MQDGNIHKTAPSRIEKSQKKVAIVAHVFYIDIWQEIAEYLHQLSIPYDLFVTLPEGMDESEALKIFNTHPHAFVYMAENRGRDVLPFLQVINIIPEDSYPYICKLHTKKTGNSPLGKVWRKLLYFDLLGSDKLVNEIVTLFETDKKVGIVTGRNTILDSERYAYGNNDKIDLLAQKCQIIYDQNYLFPAGTMFWIRTSLLKPLITLFRENQLEFEEEKGQKDNTLAHAIERFFGILAQVNHLGITPSPSDYSLLPRQTIEELANLILSQQYAGVDMFMKQKQAIEEKDQHIQNLQALAESLRIKNRLKRLIPSNIKSKFLKGISLLKVIKDNPQILKKVFYYLMRGDIAYLWQKTKEKSNKNIAQSTQFVEVNPHEYFAPFDAEKYAIKETTIDIIIPVYNGYSFLEKLFDSIEKHTSVPHRLIVINDCSPDERVKPYLLKRLKKHPNALFLDHEENQGFLKSVNEAYSYTSNHFLILNTDTEVPAFWVERLMYPILHKENVASTTPFTNSGEIASFPNFVADNAIFEAMEVNDLDNVFKEVKAENFYEAVPTGVGFCMGVNYKLTQKIGMFVEDTFGKGYGEENDWCQRAIKEGYTNLLVPNLFVYHKHGGSFSAQEKAKLLKENAVKLLGRHPNYGKDVDIYIKKDPHNTLRQMLVLKAADAKVGTHLIFDHDLGGGANIYADELVVKYTRAGYNTLLVRYDYYSDTFKITHHYKKYLFAFKISTLEALRELLDTLQIKEIFVNNLVSYPNIYTVLAYIDELTTNTKANLILPIHDYYAISPSYNLLNHEGKYGDLETLEETIGQNMQEWRNYYVGDVHIGLWKEAWTKLIDASHKILCFSHASKDIVVEAYPQIDKERIEVLPHTVQKIAPVVIEKDSQKHTITIGILGAINHVKGSQIIKQMVQQIEKDGLDIDIVVIGEITESIRSKHFKTTGRYVRDDLPRIIQENQIDIFLIPSIWPETFSYTTQEVMMMQLPLMVFNLGAPAERVKAYEKGYVIEEMSAEAVLKTVQKV